MKLFRRIVWNTRADAEGWVQLTWNDLVGWKMDASHVARENAAYTDTGAGPSPDEQKAK
jgi:hypothetical protein